MKSKKAIAVVLAMLLLAGAAPVIAGAAVDITSKFIDAGFRAAVYQKIGKTAPAPILDTDAAGVTVLDVSGRVLHNLRGLEYFTGLQELNCSDNELFGIDVTGLPLTKLNCSKNYINPGDVIGFAGVWDGVNFIIAPNYPKMGSPQPVSDITGLPRAVVAGTWNTLFGTVTPSNAITNKIYWSIADAGTTGATMRDANSLDTPRAGTVKMKATVYNGLGVGEDFVKPFDVMVVTSATYTPVSEIASLSALAEAGRPLTLRGNVKPSNATCKAIEWTLVNAGTTGATLVDGVFTATKTGTAKLNATVTDGNLTGGMSGPHYQTVFDIRVIPAGSFKPVTRIDGIPATLSVYPSGVPYSPFSLTNAATIVPSDATSKAIGWAVVSGNSTLANDAFSGGVIIQFLRAGNLRLAAVIADGTDIGVDYVQYFDISVTGGSAGSKLFGTRYDAVWYNYLLFFLCFGFIWMWF